MGPLCFLTFVWTIVASSVPLPNHGGFYGSAAADFYGVHRSVHAHHGGFVRPNVAPTLPAASLPFAQPQRFEEGQESDVDEEAITGGEEQEGTDGGSTTTTESSVPPQMQASIDEALDSVLSSTSTRT